MEIRPIRNEADYDETVAQIRKLLGAKPGTAAFERLDVLSTLAEVYEAKHHAIDPPTPIEAIKFRMEQQGLTRKDMEKYLGQKSRVSEVLSGKRRLSLEMISKLHTDLGIPLESLFEPTKSKAKVGTTKVIPTKAPRPRSKKVAAPRETRARS